MTTGIMTFLFTDIEGWTALLTRLGDAGLLSEVLEDHHRIIRSSLQARSRAWSMGRRATPSSWCSCRRERAFHGAADGLVEQTAQSLVNLEDKLRERDHSRLRLAMGEKHVRSGLRCWSPPHVVRGGGTRRAVDPASARCPKRLCPPNVR
jgi:hypothetical protein